MSNDEKRAYLETYCWIMKKIRRLEAEIEVEKATATMKAKVFDGMPHGNGGNSDLSQYFSLLEDLEEELKALLDEKRSIRNKISRLINELHNDDWQSVLTYKYLCGYSWNEVCAATERSERWVYSKHEEALSHLNL